MRLLSRLLMPILLLLFSGTAALAQEAGWRVSEAKGNVIVIDASGERKAATGLAVAPGATVRTAARSTAVLVRGREFVTLRQNAQIRIPQATKERSLMQVIQDYGSALFNIGKQRDPHFGVQTPYLAAVVKGTTFVITVGPDGATLQVTEGAVEVSTMDGGAREMILPGAVAMVAAGDMMRMVVEGDGRKVIDSPARPVSGTAAAPAAPSSGGGARVEPAAASENAANRVDEAITSSPGDVRSYSDGFASGEVAVIAAVVVSENTNRGGAPSFGSDSGRGNDGAVCFAGSCVGGGNGSGAGAGTGGNGEGGVGTGSGSSGSGNGNGGSDDGAGGNGNGGAGNGSGNGNGNGGAGNGSGNGNGNGGADNGSGNGNGNGGADNGTGNSNGNGNGAGNGGADNGSGNGNGNGNGNGAGNGGADNGSGNSNGNGNGAGNGGADNGSGNGGADNGNGNADDAPGNDPGPRVRVRVGGVGIDIIPGPRMDDPAPAPRDRPGL